MRITFLAHKLDQGGGSSFSLDLMARRLAHRGHSVSILTTNLFTDNDPPEERPYRIVGDEVTPNTPVGAFFQIMRALERYEDETDVYHVFTPEYLAIAGLYRRTGDTPTVGRLNAYSGFCTNPAKMNGECHTDCRLRDKLRHDTGDGREKVTQLPQYIYKDASVRASNFLDSVFALSPTVEEIYAHNGIDEDAIEVIPNFYDPTFSEHSPPKTNVLTDEFTILYAGRLRAEKGVDVLVDAARSMDVSDVAINIVGDGPQRDALEWRAKRRGVADSIRFHGRVDHSVMASFYTDSDVFVHPGRWPEPFGRTILEALQCECPPVVSDIGAPPWIVGDAGVTFERDSATDLAATFSALQSSESDRASLQSACNSRVERFSPESIVERIESEYRRLR